MTETLRPYQIEGSRFLADTTVRNAHLLGDEPGVGKTAQAIAACDCLYARRVLVLCMSIAKRHWAKEFDRFQHIYRVVHTVNDQKSLVDDTGVYVVNWDLIQRQDAPLRRRLMALPWDVVILDEAHVLKNPDAKKTRFVYGTKVDGKACLVGNTEHTFVLTGTPMPNHAGELWTHLHALAPDLILDPVRKVPYPQHVFQDRYCVTKDSPWGIKIVGSKNLEDLKRKIDRFMLRRRKKDVLKDLPPIDYQLYPMNVAGTVPQGLLDQLDTLQAEWSLDFEDDPEGALEALQQMAVTGKISTERRVLGEVKAHLAVELIKGELDADPKAKLIVFCHHRSVIGILHTALQRAYGAVRCDGSMNSREQADAVDQFQNDPEVRVFVGQTTAAGTSVTLHASSNVIVVEPSFVPKDNVQAAARAHRYGQKNAVLVRYLYLDGTLDEKIMQILIRKIRDIAVVLADDLENLGAPL